MNGGARNSSSKEIPAGVPGIRQRTSRPSTRVWLRRTERAASHSRSGAALLAAANPPTQAARLDIMPAGLWGRAESVRTFVRSLFQAASPLVFGGLAQLIAGIVPSQAPIGTHPHAPPSHEAMGLEVTFLIMLSTLVAAGLLTARARHTYATDVATAAASEQQPDTAVTLARPAAQPQP